MRHSGLRSNVFCGEEREARHQWMQVLTRQGYRASTLASLPLHKQPGL